jgi:hypothetical protein
VNGILFSVEATSLIGRLPFLFFFIPGLNCFSNSSTVSISTWFVIIKKKKEKKICG